MRFKDRSEAGKRLAAALHNYQDKEVVVYALPRGGVILGVEIAKALGAPLDLIIARKIGHPFNPEYAIGAVGENGHTVFEEAERAAVDPQWLIRKVEEERKEAQRRRETYLANQEAIQVEGKTGIIVDDGIATGLTMKLAIKELKHRGPKSIVVAVPVTPKETAEELIKEVDELIALDIPDLYLGAISAYYDDFPQLSDQEVIRLMRSVAPATRSSPLVS
ncbi:MAG: phosphoribosyl transferase [Acidobacteria bacterium]|nr:phosphoribosyl transferase [Acidobacteriota bacterium]